MNDATLPSLSKLKLSLHLLLDIFLQMGITQVGVRTKILDAIREVHKKEWDVASLQSMERHSLR